MNKSRKNARAGREHSLLATLVVTGASFVGIAGMAVGSILGSLAVIPVTAAAVGYSMGGWASGIAGLVMGTMANFWPLHKKTEDALPGENHSAALPDHETVRLSDYAANVCGFTVGILGAFTGAAMGAGLAGIVTMAETRQAMLNGELPRDVAARSKGRDGGPFIH